jgi:CheY-like chemotaxis protein
MTPICLIAAHDPWFIQLLKAYAVECGFRVVQAYESQEVIPLIHQESPSIILIQMDLPGHMRSREILKSIKENPITRNIPILVFYSQLSSEQIEQVNLASAILQEPISYEDFQNALRKSGVETKTSIS